MAAAEKPEATEKGGLYHLSDADEGGGVGGRGGGNGGENPPDPSGGGSDPGDVDMDRYEDGLSYQNPRTSLWIPPASGYSLIEEMLYNDPWRLLVACMLLNKTSGKTVFSCPPSHPHPTHTPTPLSFVPLHALPFQSLPSHSADTRCIGLKDRKTTFGKRATSLTVRIDCPQTPSHLVAAKFPAQHLPPLPLLPAGASPSIRSGPMHVPEKGGGEGTWCVDLHLVEKGTENTVASYEARNTERSPPPPPIPPSLQEPFY